MALQTFYLRFNKRDENVSFSEYNIRFFDPPPILLRLNTYSSSNIRDIQEAVKYQYFFYLWYNGSPFTKIKFKKIG